MMLVFIIFTETLPSVVETSNPCSPSPCGPYSECRNNNGLASCSCLSTYIGSPPFCKPECVVNSDCPSNLGCISEKCRDPCEGSCGLFAKCFVNNHVPVCLCPEGFTGDPFSQCVEKPVKGESLTHTFLFVTIFFY